MIPQSNSFIYIQLEIIYSIEVQFPTAIESKTQRRRTRHHRAAIRVGVTAATAAPSRRSSDFATFHDLRGNGCGSPTKAIVIVLACESIQVQQLPMLTQYFTNVKNKRVQALYNRKKVETGREDRRLYGSWNSAESAERAGTDGVSVPQLPSPVPMVCASGSSTERAINLDNSCFGKCVSSGHGDSLPIGRGNRGDSSSLATLSGGSRACEAPIDRVDEPITEEDWAPLLEIMDGIESARLLLRARHMRPTFDHVRAVVQRKCRRELTRKRLSQLRSVMPEIFRLECFGPGADDFCIELQELPASDPAASVPSSHELVHFGDAYAIMQRRSLLRERLQCPERRVSSIAGHLGAHSPLPSPGDDDAKMADNSVVVHPSSPPMRRTRKRLLSAGGNSDCNNMDILESCAKKTRSGKDLAVDLSGAEQASLCPASRLDHSPLQAKGAFGDHLTPSRRTRAHEEHEGWSSPMSRLTFEASPPKSMNSDIPSVLTTTPHRKSSCPAITDYKSAATFADYLPAELIQRVRRRESERDHLESQRPFDEACLNFRSLIHTADLVYSFFHSTAALGRIRRAAELDQVVAFLGQHHECAPLSHGEALRQLQLLAMYGHDWCSIDRGAASGRALLRISSDRNVFRRTRQHLEALLASARKEAHCHASNERETSLNSGHQRVYARQSP
jgi:hypothetical protein